MGSLDPSVAIQDWWLEDCLDALEAHLKQFEGSLQTGWDPFKVLYDAPILDPDPASGVTIEQLIKNSKTRIQLDSSSLEIVQADWLIAPGRRSLTQ